MPVIIQERDYDRWLKADPERPPIDLLRPLDADKMTAWKVDKAVGNVKNDSPELIEPASAGPESSENRSPETPGPLLGAERLHFGLGAPGVSRSLPAFNGERIERIPKT